MITARYEPHLFSRNRSPSRRLGGCSPQSAESEEIDRFMVLAHAALEEATKEEDAKGVLRELLERFFDRTGAPLMADVIAEQLHSQEIIEQLAEQSFERQRGRYEQQQFLPTSSLSTLENKRFSNISPSENEMTHKDASSERLKTALDSIPLHSSPPSSLTIRSDPHETMNEAVTRDQFIIQHSPSLHTGPDRLLLVSEYIWRLFRLLILASLVALAYNYICTHPYQPFLVV